MACATTYWDHLVEAEIIQAIECSFTSVMGGFFYFFIAFGLITLIQLKTERLEASAIGMLILGGLGFTRTLFPGISTGVVDISLAGLWFGMMTLGISIIFFKLHRRGR